MAIARARPFRLIASIPALACASSSVPSLIPTAERSELGAPLAPWLCQLILPAAALLESAYAADDWQRKERSRELMAVNALRDAGESILRGWLKQTVRGAVCLRVSGVFFPVFLSEGNRGLGDKMTATLQTVIGVYISVGESVKDVYVRLPVSTKTTTVDVVRALVAKNFGDQNPATFALYEAEYVQSMLVDPVRVSDFNGCLPQMRAQCTSRRSITSPRRTTT